MTLSDELAEYGCDLSPADFNDLLGDTRHAIAVTWSEEQIICHPKERAEFVRLVRRGAGSRELPEEMILWRLLNRRKRASEPKKAKKKGATK